MTCPEGPHVGDIGTIYQVRVSNTGDFDASTAVTAEIIFKMPTGIILRKTATVTGEGGSPPTSWLLSYEVEPGDGYGSPGEFHDNAGAFQMQGFLEWADGKQYHTPVQTTDEDGQELRIFSNLV